MFDGRSIKSIELMYSIQFSMHPINPPNKPNVTLIGAFFFGLPCYLAILALGVFKKYTPQSQPRFNIVS